MTLYFNCYILLEIASAGPRASLLNPSSTWINNIVYFSCTSLGRSSCVIMYHEIDEDCSSIISSWITIFNKETFIFIDTFPGISSPIGEFFIHISIQIQNHFSFDLKNSFDNYDDTQHRKIHQETIWSYLSESFSIPKKSSWE